MSKKKKAIVKRAAKIQAPQELKLDLACGATIESGFLGVDRRAMPGVHLLSDLRQATWSFKPADRNMRRPKGFREAGGAWVLEENSVDAVRCLHFVEHLWNTEDRPERVRFVNELFRVLKPGGQALIVTPHWCSSRAYGDFTHAYPPVGEFWLLYLNREWRVTKKQALDNDVSWHPSGYTCDFDFTYGYGMREDLIPKHVEVQQFALGNYKEAAQDLIVTLTKPTPEMRRKPEPPAEATTEKKPRRRAKALRKVAKRRKKR